MDERHAEQILLKVQRVWKTSLLNLLRSSEDELYDDLLSWPVYGVTIENLTQALDWVRRVQMWTESSS